MQSSRHPDAGFVYVATGDRYRREACASVASLRPHNPGMPVCLITDKVPAEDVWDDVIVLEHPSFSFRDKLEMQRAPYDRCVYLDTDTTVFGSLSDLFAVLRAYDVCGVQIAEGHDYEMPDGIPHAFPEMNGGLIGFRRSGVTAEFFALWRKYYDEFRALNETGHYHYANVGDQKSLRAALWHSRVRHACVGGEFNFIPFRVEFAAMPVAVLHTRAVGLTPLAGRLNTMLGRRSYVPSLDVVVSENMPTAEVRKLTAAALRLWLRIAGRVLVPRFARGGLRRSARFSTWLFGNRYSNAADPGAAAKWQIPKQ